MPLLNLLGFGQELTYNRLFEAIPSLKCKQYVASNVIQTSKQHTQRTLQYYWLWHCLCSVLTYDQPVHTWFLLPFTLISKTHNLEFTYSLEIRRCKSFLTIYLLSWKGNRDPDQYKQKPANQLSNTNKTIQDISTNLEKNSVMCSNQQDYRRRRNGYGIASLPHIWVMRHFGKSKPHNERIT